MKDEELKLRPASEYGLHYGDLGVIVIALFFLFGFLWLMFSPGANLKGLDAYDKASARDTAARLQKLEQAKRQKEIDAAIASGVVTVGIAPAKKH
jgi:hypothetical protein